MQTFLAEEANVEIGVEEGDPTALETSAFNVENIRFATAEDGSTSLAMAQGNFTGGGPQVTVLLRHDSGSVPRYSYMFLGASILLMGSDSKVMTPAIVEAWFSSSSELTAAMALIQTAVIAIVMVIFGLFTHRIAHHGTSAQ